jgi:hypothetical protein
MKNEEQPVSVSFCLLHFSMALCGYAALGYSSAYKRGRRWLRLGREEIRLSWNWRSL